MATVSKHGNGWRAQVRRVGYKARSRTFTLKGHARTWGDKVERELLAGRHVDPGKNTLGDAFTRYARDVSPTKRGARWEKLRLVALGRHPLARRPIGAVTSDDVGRMRDDSLEGRHRRRAVGGSTVRREMNLLDSVFEKARKEWKWVDANPVRDADKPADPPPRRRRVSDAEIRAMRAHLTGPAGRQVAAGFELGIESGMRAGEMWSLERPQIDLRARVARLLKTKNGDTREVSLSPGAVRIIRAQLADGRTRLFTCSVAVRDALFRKARAAAGVEDLHFHDSRAEAVWRLAQVLEPPELALQIGHRDLKSLMLYFRDTATERARKLAGPRRRTPSRRRRATAGAGRRAAGSASGSRGA